MVCLGRLVAPNQLLVLSWYPALIPSYWGFTRLHFLELGVGLLTLTQESRDYLTCQGAFTLLPSLPLRQDAGAAALLNAIVASQPLGPTSSTSYLGRLRVTFTQSPCMSPVSKTRLPLPGQTERSHIDTISTPLGPLAQTPFFSLISSTLPCRRQQHLTTPTGLWISIIRGGSEISLATLAFYLPTYQPC